MRERREQLLERVLNGPGVTSIGARRAAFDNHEVDAQARALIGKVARHAWRVTDADVASVKAAGMAEDEIFELTVCAAIGQASRQLQSALDALRALDNVDTPAPAGHAPPDAAARLDAEETV